MTAATIDEALTVIRDIAAKFRVDAESFYEAEARAAGFIRAKDRFGEMRKFELLGVSGVIVMLPPGVPRPGIDAFGAMAADLKAKAKAEPDHLYVQTIDG